jgi:hypothetical protein
MKTGVYRRRLSPHLKSDLQEAARTEEERQRSLHEAAMNLFGTIDGGPDLAESAKSEVPARIARQHRRPA